MAGSYPIWGAYDRFCYPAWAAKFFADAVMLVGRICDMSELTALILCADRRATSASPTVCAKQQCRLLSFKRQGMDCPEPLKGAATFQSLEQGFRGACATPRAMEAPARGNRGTGG